MKKVKKKSLFIMAGAACGIIMIVIVLLMIYMAVYPKLCLKKRLEWLLNQKYSYNITYDAEGIETDFLGNNVQGTIIGKKGDGIFFGQVTNQGMAYFDFYMNKDWNMIFNIKPLLESILNEIQESTKLPLSFFSSSLGDIFISKEQIKSVFGDVVPNIENVDFSDLKYTVKQLSDVSESNMLLGKDAYYFDITIQGYELNLLFGIPKEKQTKKISLQVSYGDVVWKFAGEYQQTDDVELEMPEETLSEETIDMARKIYDYWKKIKQDIKA